MKILLSIFTLSLLASAALSQQTAQPAPVKIKTNPNAKHPHPVVNPNNKKVNDTKGTTTKTQTGNTTK